MGPRKKIVILAAAVMAGFGASPGLAADDVDCTIFVDGIRTYEEIIELCIEFDDGYAWEPPPYEDDYPHDCLIYWRGRGFNSWDEQADACLAGFNTEGSGSSYTVQDGDLSLWSISQKYGIPFGALLDANPENPDLIRVGSEINLP